MDGMTKSALWHYWVKGEGNNELMGDIESSDEEWEESDYGNPPNTDTNLFFKPYLDAQEKNDIGKGDKRDQMNHGGQRLNEEYISLNTSECNAWKRNKESISHIYQEIFRKKDEGWTVTRTKE
ncbi:hypothetical protein Tco_1102635 [Tanacetum coccineum]